MDPSVPVPIPVLALALAFMAVIMSLVWVAAVRIRNAGIVDVAWSYNFSLLALLYAAVLPGWPPRRGLIAGMVVLWSVRLGTYLHGRVMGHHPVEDGRFSGGTRGTPTTSSSGWSGSRSSSSRSPRPRASSPSTARC